MANAALKIQDEDLALEIAVEEPTIGLVDASEQDELDAMFSELEAVMDASPEADIELDEEAMIEAGEAAEIQEARIEALHELDELATPTPDESAMATGVLTEDKPKKAPVTRRINSKGMSKADALVKALGSKLNDYLTLNNADAMLDASALQAKVDAKLQEIEGLPVKIQEKVVNFYAHLVNGAALSNYTRMALELLVKQGELTSKQLRDAYIARPYSQGTANSQTTQLMKLLPTLGLATREANGRLVANPDSTLLPMFSFE